MGRVTLLNLSSYLSASLPPIGPSCSSIDYSQSETVRDRKIRREILSGNVEVGAINQGPAKFQLSSGQIVLLIDQNDEEKLRQWRKFIGITA